MSSVGGGGQGSWGRKTVLFFEGCDPQLGCTIILRGGDLSILQKAKRALLVQSPLLPSWADGCVGGMN